MIGNLTAGALSSGFVAPAVDIVVGSQASPYILAYPWSDATGFGTKYSNPATLPTGVGRNVAFNNDKTAVAIAHSTSPYITSYAWSSGFGTKYSNPATLPTGNSWGVNFSPNGDTIAVAAESGSPFVFAYPFNSSTGIGTKYANPATLPTDTLYSVFFRPAGDVIAVSQDSSPYLIAYPWSAGFGTKYANPATLPTGMSGARGGTFNQAGNAIGVVGHTTGSDFPINVYAWSSGFGTRYSNPSSKTLANYKAITFAPDDLTIAAVHGDTPFTAFYAWTNASGFGTRYSAPGTPGTGQGLSVKFNPTGTVVATGHDSADPIHAWAWTNASGFGTKYADPATKPSDAVWGIDFK